jgi:hypothetical protein
MGIAEILRLAQLALLAILLFYLGQFVVDRLEHLPRSARKRPVIPALPIRTLVC